MMKTYSKLKNLSIILVFLFVSAAALLFFSPKPPLLKGLSFSTAVYDDHQHLLRLTLSDDEKYRLFTPLAKISPHIISATLLQEDQYFRSHYGINPWAMVKAAWQTYVLKSHRRGASTLSMQVARLRFGIHSKHFFGKIEQILRTLQLERHYSKDEILEAYFNLAPYGSNIEGVGAASLIYFGKPIAQVNLPEALMLSIIPQNPTHRTPANKQLQTIRSKLFKRWLEQHPQDRELQASIDLPQALQNLHSLPFIAPHFVNSVLTQASKDRERDINTTLDLRLQEILRRKTSQYLARKKNLGVSNAALMLVDTRDMSIKGLVGSANFFNSTISGQINGSEIKRSPGSTLKPFIYALALDQGLIHPNTVLKDVPQSFSGYNPENFDYDFMGPIKAKDALVLSRNIPAINLASQLTNPSLYQLLEEAQISQLKSENYYGLALSLGGAELTMKELTSLYAMLVNDGLWRPLRMRQEEPQTSGKRLLSPEASFLVLDMLKATPRSELFPVKESLPVAWKTGTSSGYRDAWSVGNFGPYVLTVWIGHFNNKSNPAFVGKNIAAPLFFELIDAIHHEQDRLVSVDKDPNQLHLTRIEVCKASGMLPTRYCQDREMTWFIPGKSPIKTDKIYREIAIDSRTGLRTCHINEYTQFEIYEFWPSDLVKIFKQAGIQRLNPPAFEAHCSPMTNLGLAPQITSPQAELRYIMRANAAQKSTIPLTAVTDADVQTLYWFINGTYLGTTSADQPLLWKPKAGKFVIRVLDDHGLSDAQDVLIQMDS